MGSSNYKTIQCKFFTQNLCTRGDRCTYRHGDGDVLAPKAKVPPVWFINTQTGSEEEQELAQNLSIKAWVEYPHRYNYHISGPKEECLKYFNEWILKQYPFNPYFTKITEEGDHHIKVYRSSTSD